MNTTPGELRPLLQVIADMQSVAELRTIRHSYIGEKLKGWIAALSALPAAGGVRPYFKDEAALIQFLDSLCELDGEGGDGQFKWKPAQRAIAGIKATTPQPSAAEVTFECANCECLFDGSAFASCPACDIGQDAAVGAQGDGWIEAEEMADTLVGIAHLIHHSGGGYPRLLDDAKALRKVAEWIKRIPSAAPAAGKGVDDVQVREALDALEWAAGSQPTPHAAEYAATVRAALTRQPATCECAECRRKRALTRNGSPFIMDPLPERDDSKPNSEQGLYRKFDVRRTDGSDEPGGKHHGCEYFVLDVKHDPLARAALAGYADAAEATHPQLAADLRERYTLTRQPVAGDGDADFELWQDGEFVAGSSGPRAEAWREILHYAAQYEQDGAVTIMEVIRRPLRRPAATPTDGGEVS